MTDTRELAEAIEQEIVQEELEEKQRQAETSKVSNIVEAKLIKNENGNLKRIRINLINLFRGADPKLKGLFRYNEATKEIEVARTQELLDFITIDKGLLTDTIISQLWGYLPSKWGVEFTEREITNTIDLVSHEYKYNPIKDMLERAKREARQVDPFIVILKYLNIEDKEYNRIVLDLAFRGAIARIYSPGIQFDFCLDLVGKQGTGKTTFIREIFQGFSGEVNSFTEKDDLLKMISLWAVNDDELVASEKLLFGELKRVITTRTVMTRRPYGKSVESFPVDFVFVRTTNEAGHLKDATGDRRFFPVEVFPKKPNQANTISQQDLIDIWGNYFRAYEKNKKLYYEEDSEEGKIIANERLKYKYQDDVIDELERYLETMIPEDFYSPNTLPYQRKTYYSALEQYGKGYRTWQDQEEGNEWVGTLARDKVNMRDVINEIYTNERDPKLRQKIKLYMNNLDGWRYKKNVKFGNRVTSGWQKATE